MRATLFVIAGALGIAAASASASTIQNFEILTASDLSPIGGTFNDGGTFGGTFSVDISQLPSVVGNDVALPAVDITTTAGTVLPGANYTSGRIIDSGTDTAFGIELQVYQLQFVNLDLVQVQLFTLNFVEVPGTFAGGQIFAANETFAGVGQRQDLSGDAIAVDPALAAPEPWSFTPCALGLLAICLFRRRNPKVTASA